MLLLLALVAILAADIDTNTVNTDFVGQMMQFWKYIMSAGGGALLLWLVKRSTSAQEKIANRREPPLEQELSEVGATHRETRASYEQRLSSLEGGQRLIFKKIDAIVQDVSRMQSCLSANETLSESTAKALEGVADQVRDLVTHLLQNRKPR